MGRFSQILSKEGEDVTWKKRSLGATPDPETGDLPVTWTTETIKAIVQPVRAGQIVLEAGFSFEDYRYAFVTADLQIQDRITYQNEDYEVLTVQPWYFRGSLEYRVALIRRLIV